MRVVRYIKATVAVGLVFQGSPEDAEHVAVLTSADSDHAGELVDTKSTSGSAIVAAGLVSWALLEWGAKKQGSTSRNTTEAEITASDFALFRGGLPLVSFLEQLLFRTVRYVLLQDYSGAVADIKKGYSRRMAHLPRHQKVSLGALHERLIEDPDGALELSLIHISEPTRPY